MSEQEVVVEEVARVVKSSEEGCCYGCFKVAPKVDLPGSLCPECIATRSAVIESTEEQ